MRRAGLAALLIACLGLAVPAGAQAKWGPHNECWIDKADETHHCYAIEEWEMSGYPREYGVGALALFDTATAQNIAVPGDVTHEFWIGFPGNENYIETGQLMVGPEGAHPFFSSTRNGAQYTYIAPYLWPFNRYNMVQASDGCHCGVWQFYWEGSLVKTDYGYPAWNTEVDVGMEAGTGHEPDTYGGEEIASIEPPSNSLTELKSGYGNHSHVFANGGMCVARGYPAWGDINYSTCRSGTKAFARSLSETQPVEKWEEPSEPLSPAYTAPTGTELTAKQAKKIAVHYSKRFGKGAAAATAQGSFAAAQRAVEPEEPEEAVAGVQARVAQSRTFAVALHGHFVAKLVMHGHAPASGTNMTVIEDAHSGTVEGYYIGNGEPDLAAMSASAVAAGAGEGVSGTVSGVAVRPPKHGVARSSTTAIANATITARNPVHVVGRAHSDRHGHFHLGLRPGSYRLVVRSARSNVPCEARVRVRPHRLTHLAIRCATK